MKKISAKIKRPLWVVGLNIALALTVGSTQAFANGSYSITNQDDLEAIGVEVIVEDVPTTPRPLDGSYVVTESFGVNPATGGTYVVGTFTGTFNGGGFTISGLTKPLFEVIDGDEPSPTTTISDLTLEAATGGVNGAGILAIEAKSGTVIDDVHVTGDVNGDSNVGGLLGINSGGITNSSATGNVSGIDNVGGLAGYSSGTITYSYATGDVEGTNYVGGLVGLSSDTITNSYAAGNVTGDRVVGGLVATTLGNISNSYASGNVEADDISYSSEFFGGLAAEAYSPITNSYASGNVTAVGSYIDGLVGFEYGEIVFDSYTSGNVNDTPCVEPCSPLTATELLAILNTGAVSPVFALDPSINAGRPYLISNAPPGNDGGNDEVVAVAARINFSYLLTQALDVLKKSVGFKAAKSDLSKLDLALLDQVKSNSSAPIIGASLYSYQSLTTSLSVGSLLQLEINSAANTSLQMWVKSSDGQYVLVGDVTFDKDGNAVLPGIEFIKSGSYEFIFVNSDKKDLTQPELENKVGGLTVYVNE